MRKSGKKFSAARQAVPPRPHSIEEAVPLMQKVKFAKFDETVELAMRLGVDPKHADQKGHDPRPVALERSREEILERLEHGLEEIGLPAPEPGEGEIRITHERPKHPPHLGSHQAEHDKP